MHAYRQQSNRGEEQGTEERSRGGLLTLGLGEQRRAGEETGGAVEDGEFQAGTTSTGGDELQAGSRAEQDQRGQPPGGDEQLRRPWDCSNCVDLLQSRPRDCSSGRRSASGGKSVSCGEGSAGGKTEWKAASDSSPSYPLGCFRAGESTCARALGRGVRIRAGSNGALGPRRKDFAGFPIRAAQRRLGAA